MPNSLVKTKRDERLWSRAKSKVKKQYKLSESDKDYYPIVNGIFQRMANPSKQGEAKNNIQKDKYVKLAQVIAGQYFQDKCDLNELITKVAIIEHMNADQIQNICATTNHVIHAAIMQNKRAEKTNKYIDFEIARPEKVAEDIEKLVQIEDEIYSNPDMIFKEKQAIEKPVEMSYPEFENKTIRTGQIIRQNIKNVAEAHYKISNDLIYGVDKTEENINKLYDYIRNAILGGKDPEVIKVALGKAFKTAHNFDYIWDIIHSKLIADNIVRRTGKDSDRVSGYYDDMLPMATSPIIALASDIDRRLGKIDQGEKILLTLEKTANEAAEELFNNLILEKNAINVTPVIKAVGRTGLKVLKGVGKLSKGMWKHKGKVMGGLWYGMDAVPAMTTKIPKITRNII
ncbi:MAG: hypothetical protein WCY30_00135 [Candidatus Neomarinimicrobiota bacterium]|jgi:hypothetical protein